METDGHLAYTYTLLNASTLNTLLTISCNQPVEHHFAHYYILLRESLFAGNYLNVTDIQLFSFHLFIIVLLLLSLF